MTIHQTATRADWLDARLKLLDEEKELTRRSDEVAAKRRQLPWVRIDKDYAFDTEKGRSTLADLFKGRSQLLVYHFMFGPDYTAGCPSCSSIADGFNGVTVHLENHDVAFWAVSRAPLRKLMDFRRRMGWSFDWASSAPGDFNHDFGVWFTPEERMRGAVEYNYRREAPVPAEQFTGNADNREHPVSVAATQAGTNAATFLGDRPGVSAFILRDGHVFHTYSGYSRGVDGIWGMYQWLDRAPLGRNESGLWWRHHDRYGKD